MPQAKILKRMKKCKLQATAGLGHRIGLQNWTAKLAG